MKVFRALAAFAALAGAGWALANGGYFPEESVDVEPAIPSQRAFLAHRKGSETLIVESALDAPAGDYAWVIPLPSVPTEVKPSTPGALKTLDVLMTPTVDRERKPVNNYLILFVAGAILLGLSAPHRYPATRYRASRLAVEYALVGFICMLGWIFLPRFAEYRPDHDYTATDGMTGEKAAETGGFVREHLRGDVGAYRYSVVSAQGVVDLVDWLKANQYALPDGAKPAIEAYVKKGWKFFAARLRHDGGDSRPHPIKLVFPCDKPVYPMALTSAISGDVLLDLYVVGNGKAAADGMRAWRADKLTHPAEQFGLRNARNQSSPGWRPVSHPQLATAFWEGAAITRLRGEFPAGSVSDDLNVSFEPLKAPYRATLVATAVAKDLAWLWGLVAVGIVLIPLSAVAIEWKPTPGPMWIAVGLALLTGFAFAVGRYRTLDRHDEDFLMPLHYGGPSLPTIDEVMSEARSVRERDPSMPAEDVIRVSLGGPLEDVPFGHTVEKSAGGFLVTVYDQYGATREFTIAEKDIAPPMD